MSSEPIWKQLEPNWPIIGLVTCSFLLGKWGFSLLLLPILLYFRYDSIDILSLHLFCFGAGDIPLLQVTESSNPVLTGTQSAEVPFASVWSNDKHLLI